MLDIKQAINSKREGEFIRPPFVFIGGLNLFV